MKKYYIPLLFSSLVVMSFSIGSVSEAVSNPIFNSQKPTEEIIPEKNKSKERKPKKNKAVSTTPEKEKERDSAMVIPKRKGIFATNDHFFDYPMSKSPVPTGNGNEHMATLSQMAYVLSGTVLFGQKGSFK